MELSPKFFILHKIKGNKHNSAEKGVEINMVQGRGQCCNIASTNFQCRNIMWRKSSNYGNVATSAKGGKDCIV